MAGRGWQKIAKGWDFIIVGAGSAGCVLANRLSADPDRRVLLLEAGPRDNALKVRIPAGFPKLFEGKRDWAYYTEPEPGCHDRRLFWPRGKMLGGSSSLNAMLYIRGHRRDYDRWQSEYGCEGWSYDDVLPIFKRSERQERGADAFHGAEGELDVAERLYLNPWSERFVEAAKNLGWRPNADFNGERQEGVGTYQVTQRGGCRHSAADAFLKPVLDRPNLHVLTNAQAVRLEVENGRARSVVVRQRGFLASKEEFRFEAEGEIVLAGGAINSPHLLLLSGIGPADHLRENGVEVVHDLPGVGANLQDHLLVSTVFAADDKETLDDAENLRNTVRWLMKKDGPLTTTVCEGAAFVRTRDDLPQPDLQFHFIPAALVDHGFDQATDYGVNFGPTMIKPKSRGRISLASADPLAPARIEANYFSEPDDLRTLVEGVKLSIELAATEPFVGHLKGSVWPAPEVRGDEALADFVRQRAATLYHPACSCAMGPAEGGPIDTVVDPQLRVHGLDGLRIADASIMPEVIGGNTNAPAILVGEKAAELILGGD